jgi:3-deoxy-manno-octulosonate cytidylyltransferase (CMP-KDO synthetase)
MKSVVIIPSRLAAVRLPNKPLYKIADKELISHVISETKKAYTGKIIVACCCNEIADVSKKHGVETVLTDPNLPSGTDRVYAAYKSLNEEFDVVVNLQGDMAVFPKDLIEKTLEVFKHDSAIDVATAVSTLSPSELNNDASVKVAFEPYAHAEGFGKTIYFSRNAIPHGAANHYKHIGIYAYKPKALTEFVNTKPSYLEQTERLEQLRALLLGHKFAAAVVEGDCVSVDTLDDVKTVEKILGF